MTLSEDRRIFVWKDFSEWRPALEGMFPDVLIPELEAKIRENAALVESSSDSRPFEKLSGHSFDSMIELKKIEHFRRLYSHIRVFHACRPENEASYNEKGILLRCKKNQIKRFREIFPSSDYPELTDEVLRKSIEEVRTSDPDGTVDLLLDYREFVEMAGLGGHILIYGSEYLSCLVGSLPIKNRETYLSVLRKIGKPTIIKINLPLEYIGYDGLHDLVNCMILNWVYNVAHSRTECGYPEFSSIIRKPVPPEYICGYDYPQKIPDVGNRFYDVKSGQYEDSDNCSEEQNQRKLTSEQIAEARRQAEIAIRKDLEQQRGKLKDSE